MGYPNDLLSSRSIIKHGSYALIAPEGLVNNVVPDLKIAQCLYWQHQNLEQALLIIS